MLEMKGTEVSVLVCGPGRAVRGGITAVLLAYEGTDTWKECHCQWLETHDDRGQVRKILAFARALVLALWLIPGVQIVHIHAAQRTSFCRKTIFFLIARCFRKKTILHLHAPYMDAFDKGIMNRLARYVFSRTDVVIALSPLWAQRVLRIAPHANVMVIPNPCSEPMWTGQGQRERKRVVAFIGKIERRKGYEDLLRAMSHVRAAFADAELVFAGDGEVDKAREVARELRMEDRVQFLGWVSEEKVHHILSRASVFCLPSYGEGVPMAMLEAMSHRVPVVVTPVGGIPDLIQEGVNGFLVEPGDTTGIARAIELLLASPELREEVAERAYTAVVERYAPRVVCQQVKDLYRSLDDLCA